nr:hypothetical protein [Kineosporia sp. NBRC 101731]
MRAGTRRAMMTAMRWPGRCTLTSSSVTPRTVSPRWRRPRSGPRKPFSAAQEGVTRRVSSSVNRYPTVGTRWCSGADRTVQTPSRISSAPGVAGAGIHRCRGSGPFVAKPVSRSSRSRAAAGAATGNGSVEPSTRRRLSRPGTPNVWSLCSWVRNIASICELRTPARSIWRWVPSPQSTSTATSPRRTKVAT